MSAPVRTARRWTLAVCAAAGLLAGASPGQAGELRHDSMRSAALGMDMRFNVYLPDGYDDSTATRYPVVYLLHGAGGDEHDWVRHGGAALTLDRLISRGLIRPVIAVMPTAGPDSWWTDGASAKAATAVMTELLPHIEARYRARADRSGRAIAGVSMGGYGALSLSLRHPARFCAAGLISPAVYDPLPPERSAARRATQFWRGTRFDAETWTALNYPAVLDRYGGTSLRVAMWIVSGDHDALGIAAVSADLHWRILQRQPGLAELRVVDGDHDWTTFREALPETLQYLDRQCAKAP